MVNITSAYPYIAVTLVETVNLACALNLEAKYRPSDDPSCYWDIRDIQQVCLLYRGIWKSELEDWKRGCKALTTIDWKKMIFGQDWSMPATVTPATATVIATAPAPAPAAAAGVAVAATVPPPAPSTSSAVSSASTFTASLTPQARFNEYRLRTRHRRNRLCPACQSEGCNHSRETQEGAESDDDEADDVYADEYYKYYAHAGHQTHTVPAENGTARHQETVAAVLIPGHRARVVQCIFMETF
jgi:isopentenyl diphosphate isomerase/L-lactate dehydrogenase-like FMN-dependent dehydrogenase